MKITNIVRFGVAALAMGAFLGVGLPVKANEPVWVSAQQSDYFRATGLMPPGSYSHSEKDDASLELTFRLKPTIWFGSGSSS
jgi:hypothetical protein